MKENKKSCDADFKKKAVFLSFQKETVDDVALKMKISNRTLIQWRKSYIIFGDDFTHLGKTKLSPEEKKIYDLEIKIRKLENEFKIIKGAENFLNKGLPSIYQYIAENEKDYSSYMLCKTLRVHLGTYKKWKNQYISDKQKWKMMVKDEITAIFFISQTLWIQTNNSRAAKIGIPIIQ